MRAASEAETVFENPRGGNICSALRHNAAQLASLGFEEPRGVKRSRDQRRPSVTVHTDDSTDMHFP